MKRIFFHTAAVAALVLSLNSCTREVLESESVVTINEGVRTDLDRWLERNFVLPYNIEYVYKWDSNTVPFEFETTPVDYQEAVVHAHLIKYLCFDCFAAVAGNNFVCRYMPKQVYVVSSPMTLAGANFSVVGSTDFGKRVLLSDINGFAEALTTNLWRMKGSLMAQQSFSEKVGKTTFHELMHLLNYTVDMPVSYKEITPNYLFSDWTRYEYKLGEGFISAYSRYSEMEDFAEVFAHYIIIFPPIWEERAAKDERIVKKLSLIRSYLEESFGVDIDALRAEYQNRLQKVCTGKVTYQILTDLN